MSDFSLSIAPAPTIPHRFLSSVLSLRTSGPSQAEDVTDYWRQWHTRGDGDIGSSQLAFLHHISTTKGNYFVAAQPSCFHPSPGFRKHDSNALNASGSTYRCPSNLFLYHRSKLPMLPPTNVPLPFSWHSSVVIWALFFQSTFPGGRDQTIPFSHKLWLLCLLSSSPWQTLSHLHLQ